MLNFWIEPVKNCTLIVLKMISNAMKINRGVSMDNRAVSPVIATVLLIAVTIGAMALAYSWITSLQSPAQEKGSEVAGRQLQEVSGAIKIESAVLNTTSGGTSVIYIRNVGAILLSGFTLYVNGELDSLASAPSNLTQGQLGNITTTRSFTSGSTYTFKVTSAQGASATTSRVAG